MLGSISIPASCSHSWALVGPWLARLGAVVGTGPTEGVALAALSTDGTEAAAGTIGANAAVEAFLGRPVRAVAGAGFAMVAVAGKVGLR
jgi:hypothetical protein